MSASLFAGILQDFDAFLAGLRPASFRGVPFEVDGTAGKGGRRLVTHEFVLRDTPYTEDLGRLAQHHQVHAFVIGPAYTEQRDALISACQDSGDAGTLIHPHMGALECRAGPISWAETKEAGGLCALTIEFVEDGPQPSPLILSDTASALLDGLGSLQMAIDDAFAAGFAGTLLSDATDFTGALLSDAVSVCAALPLATIGGLGPQIAAIAAFPADAVATASSVMGFMLAAADQVVAGPLALGPRDVLGSAAMMAPIADISGGLAGLAGWLPTR